MTAPATGVGDLSTDDLRERLGVLLDQLERTEAALFREAANVGCDVYQLRNLDGGLSVVPVLAAEATVLAALTMLHGGGCDRDDVDARWEAAALLERVAIGDSGPMRDQNVDLILSGGPIAAAAYGEALDVAIAAKDDPTNLAERIRGAGRVLGISEAMRGE